MQHLQHIAELGPNLLRYGIRHVIVAPGSRNAPLIQLFTSNSSFSCYSIVDERSAGYVALGMARQLREPVAIVTTSGTAVMNLAPAVAEAYKQQIPLIVLTADRPLEQIPQFNNQVIDQIAPFFNHSKGFFEFPPVLRTEEDLQHSLASADQLIETALTYPQGPVHINLPMEEPLYEMLPEPLFSSDPLEENAPNTQLFQSEKPLPSKKKIVILAGMGVYNEEAKSTLEGLTHSFNLVVVAENITNMPSDRFIAHPELILAGADEKERTDLAPDLVIAFGGQVVSKRLKLFVQSLKQVETRILEGDPSVVIKGLKASTEQSGSKVSNSYLETWKQIEVREQARASRFFDEVPFCNLTAIHEILFALPEDAMVHLGNSAAIRYSQLVPVRRDLLYYSNRGTSGIDGSVSAAVGASLVSDRTHVLVVGDLSFVYDSNALWNKNFPQNLKIIVLNDGGGGIFRLLEGPDRMDFFEEYSVTHHPVSLELLSQAFGRDCSRVTNREELQEKLETLFSPGSILSVLEVDTTGSENSRIFKQFFKK